MAATLIDFRVIFDIPMHLNKSTDVKKKIDDSITLVLYY